MPFYMTEFLSAGCFFVHLGEAYNSSSVNIASNCFPRNFILNSILPFVLFFQIQHPRTRLDRFDLVVTPRHDYHVLSPSGQQEIPQFIRRWITPREPPSRTVVCYLFSWPSFQGLV